MKIFFFILFLVSSLLSAESSEKEIVVIIPSYNNEQWYTRNLQSVLDQNYHNFRVIYVNDCSTDRTAERVEAMARAYAPEAVRVCTFDGSSSIPENAEKFKEMMSQEKGFFTLVNNTSRCGSLENCYRVIQSCAGPEIIFIVDGDDWLAHNGVLQKINKAYCSKDIWMTHGKFREHPTQRTDWCEPVPPALVASNTARKFIKTPAVRTFYAWLFNKIELQDLLFEGKFFAMAYDMAFILPILEMAAERHHFFPDPDYVYNKTNPINDSRVNPELQQQMGRYIRDMKPYQRLEKAE